ncbi:MAG: alpha/beta fold hydrolase [Burkholderiaceae bacterium]
MRLTANGLALEVEDAGPRGAPPLLLVMGLGMQLVGWPDDFVALLLERGLRVIRFDNRDAGLSEGFDHLGVPSIRGAALRHLLGLRVRSPYGVRDMAADTLGVMDALGLPQAHVCGASLGGMISQHLAAANPARVASLTLMMTASGSRRLPGPTLRARRALLSRPASLEMDALIDHSLGVLSVIGSPAFRADPAQARRRAAAGLQRAFRPDGTVRQLLAIAADDDRSALLARIRAPTAVIHGVADPLIPVANGRDLVRRIAGATGDFIDGMGHDLPRELLPRFADSIAANARRARGS